jgi:hypothetical protein
MSDEKKSPQTREVTSAPATKTYIERGEIIIKGNVPKMENPPPPPKSNDK